MTSITFSVPGMTCGHCKSSVETELKKVAGISAVEVDLDTKDVVVQADGVLWEQIVSAIDEAGFEAVAK